MESASLLDTLCTPERQSLLRVSPPEAVAYLLELEQHWRQYTRGVRKVVDISASTTPLSIIVYPILTERKI